MTATDQEALFKQVQSKFAGMSNRWHSGYVAGVVVAELDRLFDAGDNDSYATGYLQGYLDASGPDALFEHPYNTFNKISPVVIDYRWWAKKYK